MVKNKRIFRIFIIAAAACAYFAAIFSINNTASATVYHYFENPSVIASDADYLYVADGFTLSAFSLDGYSRISDKPMLQGGAVSICADNGAAYTVENGDIYYYDFTVATSDTLILSGSSYNGFSSVYTDENNIYAAADSSVFIFDKTTLSLSKELFGAAEGVTAPINHFSVLGDTVYASVSAMNRSSVLIQNISAGGVETAIDDTHIIYGLAAVRSKNALAVLSGGAVTYYSRGITELHRSVDIACYDAVKICAGENVFALSSVKSVLKFEDDLSGYSEALAYRSSAHGFYNNPVDIVSRFNKIYVADRGNNRIAVNDSKSHTSFGSLIRPVAIALSGDETAFIAHAENRLAVFDNTEKLVSDGIVKIQNGSDIHDLNSVIQDIKFDGRDNLFLLTRTNELFLKKADTEVFTPIQKGAYNGFFAIDAQSDGLDLFALANGNSGTRIARLSFDAEGNIKMQDLNIDVSNAIDIAADADGNSVYILKPSNTLQRYSLESGVYTQAYSGTIAAGKIISKIAVSAIDNDFAKFRDIIALDSTKNTLTVIPHTDLGVTYSDPSAKESLSAEYKTLLSSSVKLVRTITREGGVNVYAQKSEVSPIRTLPKNFKVLVPEYNKDEKFTKIICDTVNIGSDSAEETLTVGYVNTAYLSDALPYSTDHASSCNVWLHSISVYSLPSRQAPKIEGFESVEKNTAFELLDFVTEPRGETTVYGYKDNFLDNQSSIWYRVKIIKDGADYEGFVFAANISILGGNPDLSVRPQTNAVIIAKSKDAPDLGAYAYYYDEESGEYMIDARHAIIAVGTKVEVVGVFDSTETYTKILYYSAYGTVEVFVETANIKYQGVNFVQIIAIIIICLTLILIGFLITRRMKKQREALR